MLYQFYVNYLFFSRYTTAEKLYIEPKSGEKVLVIDRVTNEIHMQSCLGKIDSTSLIEFCGFLGAIKLLAGNYLVIATHRQYVGIIAGQTIWQLAGIKLIPYFKSTLHLSQQEKEDNDSYVNMVEQVLATPYIYFSYTYDLTHTMQRLHSSGPEFLSQSLIERADARFLWNMNLLLDFRNPVFANFTLPLIQGFVSIYQCMINGCSFSWGIISRRSILRPGTRLYKRGIDKDGNVANFVETEQIVEYQGDRCSFVQIRGSIPLYWSQYPNLKYKPKMQLLDISQDEQILACSKHLEAQTIYYGRLILVDLVDNKGGEGNLKKAFKDATTIIKHPSVRYEPFDFHAECRHMRWDRLSILIDRVACDQDEMGFFLLLRDGSLISMQDGIFRTNCVDCLDRTNVVQSMLARRSLNTVLHKLNILNCQQNIEDQVYFESLFKSVWADHADAISIQYSGTGALKTDFTRTGKRTRAGMLRDGMNSLTRYYKNNFADGFRQDSIDLFLGYGTIRTPLRIERGWRYLTFPLVLLIAFAMFVACSILPSEYSTESLLFLLFWGSMVFATGTTIVHYGPEFVDKPRLSPIN